MASHVACEAVRKGLETQIAELTSGYDNEINRLQVQITALSGDSAAAVEDLHGQITSLTEQHATEIAQLKARQTEDLAKLRADHADHNYAVAESWALDNDTELEKVRKGEQAKYQHVAAKLEAQAISLQHALEDTQKEMNARDAHKIMLDDLQKKHAENLKEVASKKGSTEAIVPTLRSTKFRSIPSVAVKRTDTLATLSKRLADHHSPAEGAAAFDFGLPCLRRPSTAFHRLAHDSTFEELSVGEGSELWYTRQGKSFIHPDCTDKDC